MRFLRQGTRLNINLDLTVPVSQTIPVSLKLGYHFSAVSAFLFRLSHSGVKGLVLFVFHFAIPALLFRSMAGGQ